MAEEEPPSASTPLVGPSSGGGNGGVTKPPSHSPPVADLVNPWVLASLALPLATFASGFTGAVADVPMKYYFYDTLGLGANQYYVYSAVVSIPSNFVVIVGLLADCLPIRGRRCKYYVALGRLLWLITYVRLATSTSQSYSSILWYSVVGEIGDTLASSMIAMLIIDRVKMESEDTRGLFQATCMLSGYIGKVVGQVTAAVTYGNDLDVPGFGDGFSIAVIFLLCAIVPTALVLPFLPALHEPECRGADVRNVLVECRELFHSLCEPTVYVIVAAFVITNLVIVDNEWHSVMLIEGCGPSVFTYAMLKVVQVTLMALATYVYRRKEVFTTDFRVLLIGGFLVYEFFKYSDALGVLLVGGPWQPDKCIAWLGIDDVMFDAASTLMGDAGTIIVVLLCRGRRTGTLYLLLVSVTGTGGSISGIICEYLGMIWPISTSKIETGVFAGYIKLQIFATSISLVAIPFFWYMLPATRGELRAKLEATKAADRSPLVGAFYVVFWIVGSVMVMGYGFWYTAR